VPKDPNFLITLLVITVCYIRNGSQNTVSAEGLFSENRLAMFGQQSGRPWRVCPCST